MPYQLTWEPVGVYREYLGEVTIAERHASFEAICRDARFDELRYAITDCRGVTSYEVTEADTAEIAALHIGPQLTNPRIVMAAVATRPDVIAAIEAFKRHGFTSAPYEVFARLEDARAWVAAQLARRSPR